MEKRGRIHPHIGLSAQLSSPLRVNETFPRLTERQLREAGMVVRTQGNGREDIGLHIGTANARRYFPKNIGTVELCLGDLKIRCRLSPAFWDGEPEIHDPRLCEWLKFKVLREQADRKPVALAMVQSGRDSFTLQAIPAEAKRAAGFVTAA